MNPFFWLQKSTTVRAINALQVHLPELSAQLARHRFTRTNPRPRPVLGQTELPHRQWRLAAEGEQVLVYAWGDPDQAERVALVVHGWNGCAWQLHPVIEALRSEGYAVVAFDQVGHGQSSGRHSSFPQFARMLERVGRSLPRLDLLVGHSMGASAGALAVARGLPVQAAVLIAPPADVREYIGRFASHLALTDRVRHRLGEILEERERVDLSQLVPEAVVSRLRLPALIISDRQDREVPVASVERWHRSWQGSELLLTEGLGHTRLLASPEVTGAVARFGSSHPAAPGSTRTRLDWRPN